MSYIVKVALHSTKNFLSSNGKRYFIHSLWGASFQLKTQAQTPPPMLFQVHGRQEIHICSNTHSSYTPQCICHQKGSPPHSLFTPHLYTKKNIITPTCLCHINIPNNKKNLALNLTSTQVSNTHCNIFYPGQSLNMVFSSVEKKSSVTQRKLSP